MFVVDRILVIAVVNVVLISVGNRSVQELRKMTTTRMLEIVANELVQIGVHYSYITPAIRAQRIGAQQRSSAPDRLNASLKHVPISKSMANTLTLLM